ncbi:hypothetical protein BY996DRAFT_4572754 [Phakopsora pachyrhizi]|uniref:Expressed protein n=1 Tax=Phakopsora pachyrhizi TaxID=170000 RepID=A0AAV0AU94_PHAPC|nr:hypothetical protein BY996DRAFT_4572754 [Phakopsora pachyrhizi]CAH7671261.1 expressed protein [Phakopsora pachyrhizi]
MTNVAELIPTSIVGWSALHQRVAQSIGAHPSTAIKRLLLVMSLLCPFSALLYSISAFKRSNDNGLWLLKFDDRGYLRPNAYILIPIIVIIYTLVNLASLITFQIDQHSYFKPHTLILHLTTFPILVCLAWTKLWSILFSMPPSKYGLLKSHNVITRRKILSAKVANSLAIFISLMPFAVTMPMVFMTIKPMSDGRMIWLDFDKSSQVIADPDASDGSKSVSELRALVDLEKLIRCEEKLLRILRAISGCYVVLDGLLLIGYIYAHFRILRALFFQVNVLRASSKRRHTVMLDYCNDIQKDFEASSSKNHFGNSGMARASESTEESRSTRTWVRRHHSFSTSIKNWKDWLPRLIQGTAVSGSVWKSSLFTRGKQEWETMDEIMLSEQFKILKSYTANTFWQATLACIVGVSYMVLDWTVLTNSFDVPKSHSLVELNYFIIVWSNISWNLGIGILLGTISCVVAYSSKPKLPEEPSQRIVSYENE